MYETHFHLTARPFVAAPVTDFYFPADSIEDARRSVVRVVERAEGPALIVGPPGSGKSLLCRVLSNHFRDRFEVVLLSSAQLANSKELLQAILFELGLEYRDQAEGELRLTLLDHLKPRSESSRCLLLIVDEAHALSYRLLEEIRMMTNLVRDHQPRVRLVLAGNARLEEKFSHPKLESFQQRIAARCYLDSFTRDETVEYIRSRLVAAGAGTDDLFTDAALDAVHRASDGIPRLINQICDHALVLACAGGKRQIDGRGIQEAWADLQQLPGPWQLTKPAHPPEPARYDTIEFGSLDDDWEPAADGRPAAATPGATHQIAAPTASIAMPPLVSATLPLPRQDVIVEWSQGGNLFESNGPANPFGDDFPDEEVVIASHKAREVEAFRGRPKVRSRDGREIAATLERHAQIFDLESPAVSPTEAASAGTAARGVVESPRRIETVVPVRQGRDPAYSSAIETPQPVAAVALPVIVPAEQEPIGVPRVLADDPLPSPWAGDDQFIPDFRVEVSVFEPNLRPDLTIQAFCEMDLSGYEALQQLEHEADVEDVVPLVRIADHRQRLLDDRDLLVVDDDDHADPRGAAAAFATGKRVDYTRLLAQLREA